MKKIAFPSLIICCLLLLVGCKNGTTLGKSVSGAANEVLLVIDEEVYRSEGGEAMFYVLNEEVPHLPQDEPMFKMSRLPYSMFDDLLKTTRNIVFVRVDSTRYTTAKINLTRNRWATTQAIAEVTAPNSHSLRIALEKNGHRITDYFIKAERERMISYYKANINNEALQRTYKKFGCQIAIPTSLNKYEEADNFLWMTNGNGAGVRQDFIIYSVPYISEDQLTAEAIVARRDSVFKANVPGGVKGSYMGIEKRYDYPETKAVTVNKAWAAETRGLWKMIDGESMGGPFVSLTRIDEMNMRIVTVEGFVFAPNKEKRNPLRQMDAMVYSLLLPHEINAVEVTVPTSKQ